jgi:2-oxo-3-hexenedioate decarboxylase/2-keto-4-pentenoate hydratase
MVLRDPGETPSSTSAAQFCRPKIEPEVAFRLAAPLAGPDITPVDVLAACDAVAPALEIVDSRIRDWRIALADTIADNASSAAVVLGAWLPLNQVTAPRELTAQLTVNDEVVDHGRGNAVLGDPARPVAWLAATLASLDDAAALEPGRSSSPARSPPPRASGPATASPDGARAPATSPSPSPNPTEPEGGRAWSSPASGPRCSPRSTTPGP